MKIIECEQSSLEWLVARSGVPTASEWSELVTPEFEIRKGEMPKTYLNQKIAEVWMGGPIAGAMTIDMEFGKILEEEAVPWYEFEFSEPVRRVGFVTSDDGRIGCSPDGLIADGGLEIKCPMAHTHVGYLRNGEVPKQYRAQVHGSMLVTGAPWWKFVSYRRGFPPLVKLVERDEKIIETLKQAVDVFLEELEKGVQRLEEMSGKKRPDKPVFAPQPKLEPKPEVEDFLH